MERIKSRHISRLRNIQFAIQDRTKEAIEEIREYIKLYGKIEDIDKDEKHHVLVMYMGDESSSCYITDIILSADEKEVCVCISDGNIMFEDNLTSDDVLNIITIIQEGHGKYNKPL